MTLKIKNIHLARYFFLVLGFCTLTLTASAQAFSLGSGDVIGGVRSTTVKPGDTLAQIARNFDMGYTEMLEANPGVDPEHLTPGTVLVVPTEFILPNAPRDGIVVNLAEMRLYYYPKGRGEVDTYPMGIGREGENTPEGTLHVIEHIAKPTWHAPESIRIARADQGVYLPKSIPPGPDNPLGEYAMRLSNYTYLIHGTNDPLGGIGRRSSSGCLRMYPEDIQRLFYSVPDGTNVHLINQPYKAGWSSRGELFFESHVALNSDGNQAEKDASQIHNVIQVAAQRRNAAIDWNKAMEISGETQGLPQEVGKVAG